MKFLFDLFPVILFFAAYKITGIYPEASLELAHQWFGSQIDPKLVPILISTAVTMLATLVQISIAWIIFRKIGAMLWISFGIIMLFGGATLLFQNPTFIKWKPTALFWLFGSILAISSFFFKKNLLQKMMGAQISLPDHAWVRLNFLYIGFFTLMGGLNLYVAYNYPEPIWVNFKVFWAQGLIIAFTILQVFYISRFIKEEE